MSVKATHVFSVYVLMMLIDFGVTVQVVTKAYGVKKVKLDFDSLNSHCIAQTTALQRTIFYICW